ncbi:MAG: hypothetical protein ABR509_00345 [Candidatus Limnocylindria bacterium]
MTHSLEVGPARVARILLAAGLVCGGLVVSTVSAFAADPPGNNGTVKIDGVPLDPGPGDDGPGDPDNEPHVGCEFAVDWYGFDEGELYSEVVFQAWPSTGERSELDATVVGARTPEDGSDAIGTDGRVYIGEDANGGGGSTDGLDASVSYDLSAALAALTPHPEQGYHVKLTVHSDGSQGADTKHKVFWVEPCAGEEQGETPTTGGSEGDQSGGVAEADNGGGDVLGARGGGGGAMLPDTAAPASGLSTSMPLTAGILIIGGTVAAAVLGLTRRRA